MADEGSFDHYYCEALLLLLDLDDQKGAKAVLLNHLTPWDVTDLNPQLAPFGSNPVFLGGERGRDTMQVLHAHPELRGAVPLGDTGLYLGGLSEALALVEAGRLESDGFKFFYKVSEWLPGQLEKELGDGLWECVSLERGTLLQQHGDRSMWSSVRASMANEVPLATELETHVASTTAEGGIDVVGYRSFKGNAQWRVRWKEEDELSWEVFSVVEAHGSDEVLRQALELQRRDGD